VLLVLPLDHAGRVTGVARVTYRKSGGDDRYSWALFVDGRRTYSGMDRREARWRADRAKANLAAGRAWDDDERSAR
jgi:hypothetical protein